MYTFIHNMYTRTCMTMRPFVQSTSTNLPTLKIFPHIFLPTSNRILYMRRVALCDLPITIWRRCRFSRRALLRWDLSTLTLFMWHRYSMWVYGSHTVVYCFVVGTTHLIRNPGHREFLPQDLLKSDIVGERAIAVKGLAISALYNRNRHGEATLW